MVAITVKYSIGDVVYHAGTVTECKQHPCPDCKGERKWKAVSPAGSEYTFSCPRCAASYQSDRDLSLNYTRHVPAVSQRIIGSVRFNSEAGSYDYGAQYMCCETGIGSGTIYKEADLFLTEDEARTVAEAMALRGNRDTEWIAKLYDKTLELSDFQLENALLKCAKDENSKAWSLLYNIRDLFDTINEADDKEAILEAIEDYKRWHFESDQRAIARDTDGTATAAANGDLPVPQDCQAGAEGIAHA